MYRSRSKLFTPGSSSTRFATAAASPADLVVLDLEDGVAPTAKAEARDAVADALRSGLFRSRRCGVRINDLDTGAWIDDLRAVVTEDLDEIHVPKVVDPRQLTTVDDVLATLERAASLDPIAIVPTIESPGGFEHLTRIVTATPRLAGLQFGVADLVTSLPIEPDTQRLGWFRVRLAVAAASVGVPATDSAYFDHGDLDGFRAEAVEARRWGMSGKSCIHPAQVPIANEAFSTTGSAGDQAIVDAFDAAVVRGEGVVSVDGRMVDRPVAEAARQRLEGNDDR